MYEIHLVSGGIRQYFEMLDIECGMLAPGYIQAVKSITALILAALIRNYSGAEAKAEYEKTTPDYRRMSVVESSFFDDYVTLRQSGSEAAWA